MAPPLSSGVSAESAVCDQQRPENVVNNTATDSWLAAAAGCRVAAYSTVSDRRIRTVNNTAPDSRTFDIASERPVITNNAVRDCQSTLVLDAARFAL